MKVSIIKILLNVIIKDIVKLFDIRKWYYSFFKKNKFTQLMILFSMFTGLYFIYLLFYLFILIIIKVNKYFFILLNYYLELEIINNLFIFDFKFYKYLKIKLNKSKSLKLKILLFVLKKINKWINHLNSFLILLNIKVISRIPRFKKVIIKSFKSFNHNIIEGNLYFYFRIMIRSFLKYSFKCHFDIYYILIKKYILRYLKLVYFYYNIKYTMFSINIIIFKKNIYYAILLIFLKKLYKVKNLELTIFLIIKKYLSAPCNIVNYNLTMYKNWYCTYLFLKYQSISFPVLKIKSTIKSINNLSNKLLFILNTNKLVLFYIYVW